MTQWTIRPIPGAREGATSPTKFDERCNLRSRPACVTSDVQPGLQTHSAAFFQASPPKHGMMSGFVSPPLPGEESCLRSVGVFWGILFSKLRDTSLMLTARAGYKTRRLMKNLQRRRRQHASRETCGLVTLQRKLARAARSETPGVIHGFHGASCTAIKMFLQSCNLLQDD